MLEELRVRSVRGAHRADYEWVVAEATYAVDPEAEANAGIVDLRAAPRDADGLVRFTGDVGLLRPAAQPAAGARALLSVCNRGMVTMPFATDPNVKGLAGTPATDQGFLLDRGWTVVFGGWQWDVDSGAGLAGLRAPLADGVPPGTMRSEFMVETRTAERGLADRNPLGSFTPYPTADTDDPDARLTVRTSQLGPRTEVPRSAWRFTSPTTIAADGGFQPFHWYELCYRSAYAPVVGAGLLAVRDLGAHLRRDHDRVFGYGISQTGRFLREFVHLGLNADERGARVFDGLFVQIASARRGEFNRRHAQPSLLGPLMPEYGPPHDTAALLARQRALGPDTVPKLMLANSAYEYWRGDGALVHQDAGTGADLPEDPDARVHLLSGTDHLGPAELFKRYLPLANPPHHLDPNPVLRALFAQLVAWACDGVEPAASRVPRRADGTAVPREAVLARFPDAARPDPALLPYTPAIDPVPAGAAPVWPLPLGAPLPALVSAVDASGNETAGIRLPQVATGLAAYTGWNPRKPVPGLPAVLYDMPGSRLPTQSPALPTPAQLRAATESLRDAGFLLAEDVEPVLTAALAELTAQQQAADRG